MSARVRQVLRPLYLVTTSLVVFGCASQSATNATPETQERVRIAAATMQDAVVIDCQLPGRLMALGGQRQYLSSGPLQRLTAIDCRTRGGEYSMGDLSGGTLSLKRWEPLAQHGDAEAQYYVARIYANGMNGVPVDYTQAAAWYGRAAKQQYKPAMQELGFLYESGLGVPQDKLLALNLQRDASGLGDELDYAWKLTAAQDDAAKRTAELSQQLEASNGQLETMRARLSETEDGLERSRAGMRRSENAVLQLRSQLAAQQLVAQQNSGANAGAKVKELEAKLVANESELVVARSAMDSLRAAAASQQSALETRLQQSQAASSQLNEALSAHQDETKSLRARLAQSEQRLITSQQELSDLRLDYRRQVDQVTADRDALDQARAKTHNNDAAAALRAVREHELELQSLRVQTLEGELAKLRAAQSDNRGLAGQAKQTEAQNAALKASLADLENRYTAQIQLLHNLNDQMVGLRSKSQSDQAALFTKLSDDVTARTVELTAKQRRIESLESDTSMLKGELARLRDEQSADRTAASNDATRAQLALQVAQQKFAEQRDQLDQLRTDAAKERAALIADRANLQQQLAEGQKAGEQNVTALKSEIQARQALIAARDERIAALEKKVAEPTMAAIAKSLPPMPDGLAPAAAGDPRLAVPVGTATFYALVIGNSNYRYLSGVATPSKDAESVGELLEQRYGFKVTRLLNATADEIMRTLDNYTIDLKETDRLLIYYAGHGNLRVGPPERAFWLGTDADPRTQTGWIPADYVSDKIKQIKAKHVLLVSDSCFSSSITHPITTTIRPSLNERRFQIEWNRRARMVLTSGSETPVADPAGDPNHSRFAKYFLSVLRQNEGLMSGEMLSYELESRMQSAAVQGAQVPSYTSLQDSNHANGDFFFLPSVAPTRVASLVD